MTVPSKLASSQIISQGRSKEQSDAILSSEPSQAYLQGLASRVRADTARSLAIDNTGNFWPNATSEKMIPTGADLTQPDWAAMLNAGAGAFSGNWVRQLTSALNTRTVFGDAGDPTAYPVGPSVGVSYLGLKVPCSPDQAFTLSAQARITAGGGSASVLLEITFLDASGAAIGLGGTNTGATPTVGGSWVSVVCPPAFAPAGACYVHFTLQSRTVSITNTTAQFDSIIAQRQLEAESDSVSNAPSLTLSPAGNVWTDIPGTSQTFTPATAYRKIKVTLTFSAFCTSAPSTTGTFQVRIVFGGVPTQAGVTYTFGYSSLSQHLNWCFMWSLLPATLGVVGNGVAVRAQVISITGTQVAFTMNSSDHSSLFIEEVG